MVLKSDRNGHTKTTILISDFVAVVRNLPGFEAFAKNRRKRRLGEGAISCCGEALGRFAEKITLWPTFCGGTPTGRGPQHDFLRKTSGALGQNKISRNPFFLPYENLHFFMLW